MKDQKGVWMAVKVFPHAVANFKNDVPASPGLQYRWKNGETRDPFYIVGTFEAPSNNKHLLWFEYSRRRIPMAKAAHVKAVTRKNRRSPRPGILWTIRERLMHLPEAIRSLRARMASDHEHALPRPEPNAGLQAGRFCLMDILQGQMAVCRATSRFRPIRRSTGSIQPFPPDRQGADHARPVGVPKTRKHRSFTRSSKVCPAQRGAGDRRYSGV